MEQNKEYIPPANRPFLCRSANARTFHQLKNVFDKFSSFDKLCESIHDGSTQKNEGLNNAIARVAPKFKHYGATMTLKTRIFLVAAIANIGYKEFYLNFLPMLGIAVNDDSNDFMTGITRFDINKKNNYVRKISADYKRKRRYQIKAKIRQQVYEQIVSERQNYGDYASGVALEDEAPQDDPGCTNANNKSLTNSQPESSINNSTTNKKQRKFCNWCQQETNHTTWRSKDCVAHNQYQEHITRRKQLTQTQKNRTGTDVANSVGASAPIVEVSRLSEPNCNEEAAALNMLALVGIGIRGSSSKIANTQNTEKNGSATPKNNFEDSNTVFRSI